MSQTISGKLTLFNFVYKTKVDYKAHLFSFKTVSDPSMEEHGLNEDSLSTLEYIIGPNATIGLGQRVYIDPSLIQLCLNCNAGRRMYLDFDRSLQNKLYIEELAIDKSLEPSEPISNQNIDTKFEIYEKNYFKLID